MSATKPDIFIAAALAGALIAGSAVPPETRDAAPLPEPEPKVQQTPRPARTGLTLTGTASWYDYVPGGAAAGPKLRNLLGKHWRGQRVLVCIGDDCTRVTLSDWCQCYWKQARERIIDLDVRSFARLASTSRGVIKVTVLAE